MIPQTTEDIKLRQIKLLLLEDTPEDVKLILHKLKRSGFSYSYRSTHTSKGFSKELDQFDPDIVLADYRLPGFSGLDALEIVRKAKRRRPFIFVTGTLGEDVAVETIKMGADDYVLKDNLHRLPSSISRTLREHHQVKAQINMQRQLREQHNLLDTLMTSLPECVDYRDKDGHYLMVNKAFESFSGTSREKVLGVKEPESSFPHFFTQQNDIHKIVLNTKMSFRFEKLIEQTGKKSKYIESVKTPVISDDGEVKGVVTLSRDISDYKEKENKLVRKEKLLNKAQKIANMGSFELMTKEDVLNCTLQFRKILEIESNRKLSLSDYIDAIHPSDKDFISATLKEAISNVSSYEINHRIVVKGDKEKVVKSAGEVVRRKVGNKYIITLIGTIQDITTKRNADKAMHEGQEMERKRLSREIHDGVSQMLIALKYNLAMMEEEIEGHNISKSLSYIQKLDKTIDNIVDETRRIINDLSIKSLEEFGIEKAVNSLCNQIEGMNDFHIHTNIDIEEQQIEDPVAIGLFRVIQEALNNISKYASATKVEINLIQHLSNIDLEVIDNGLGIDPKNNHYDAKHGNGMSNMKERVGIFNGSMMILSEPNEGTTIKVKIPNSSVKCKISQEDE